MELFGKELLMLLYISILCALQVMEKVIETFRMMELLRHMHIRSLMLKKLMALNCLCYETLGASKNGKVNGQTRTIKTGPNKDANL